MKFSWMGHLGKSGWENGCALKGMGQGMCAGHERYYITVVLLIAAVLSATCLAVQSGISHTQPVIWGLCLALLTVVLVDSASSAIWLLHAMCKRPGRPETIAGAAEDVCRDVLIAIPVLLAGDNSKDLASVLERRFLESEGNGAKYCLLTDFADASLKNVERERLILNSVRVGIDALNQKHCTVGEPIFYLLHRHRVWNVREALWMGRERKRGKLSALNALLRGAGGDNSIHITAFLSWMTDIRYVFVLDVDTELDVDTTRRLRSVLEHPLNEPHFNAADRVIGGFAIAQPAIWPSLSPRAETILGWWGGNSLQHSPVRLPDNDLLQDLFGEGTFFGKGMYNVDAFERATRGAFPENLVLSHDLPEGSVGRVVNVNDALVYERCPTTYRDETRRRARWMRGDWQNLLWVSGLVADGRPQLAAISVWKIVDNVRRNLAPVFLIAAMLIGAHRFPDPDRWLTSVLAALLVPVAVSLLVRLCQLVRRRPTVKSTTTTLIKDSGSTAIDCVRKIFELAMLPHSAWLSIEAIVRSTWRVFVSKRRTLEWQPSGSPSGGRGWLLTSAAWSGALAGWMLWSLPGGGSTPLLVSVAIIWALSPLLGWLVSLPILSPKRDDVRADSGLGRFADAEAEGE